MSTYAELLKDPRWQKKRLEVMEAAGFSCVECGEDKKPLNIHHGYYEKGMAIWDYPNDSLWCLCEDCHRKIHLAKQQLNQQIGKLTLSRLENMYGYAAGLRLMDDDEGALAVKLSGFEHLSGVGAAWSSSEQDIYYALDGRSCVTAEKLRSIPRR